MQLPSLAPLFLAFALLTACATPPPASIPPPPAATPASIAALTPPPQYSGMIGVEGDFAFVDLAKTLRTFEAIDGSGSAPTDSQGWPTSDARSVIFDHRPVFAWAPPIDDPDAYQPDMSGTYKLTLTGNAQINIVDGNGVTIENQVYDAATNMLRADLVLRAGSPALVYLSFTKTQRTPKSPLGSGFSMLRIIRPGYAADTTQIFTDQLVAAYAPFGFIRFMGATGTNNETGFYGDAGNHALAWDDRPLPTDATQEANPALRKGKRGVAWEYVLLLANATSKDVWINLPVSATGSDPADQESYVYQLARLFRDGNAFTGDVGLKPGLRIYVEHSNEVWNFGFPQYIYNRLAAEDDVKRGDTALVSGGESDSEIWAHRRHARRAIEIGQIFTTVFGEGSRNTRVFPIYAGWAINPTSYYADVLDWVAANYGPPKDYFYAVGTTAYLNDDPIKSEGAPTATVPDVIAAMRNDSINTLTFMREIRTVAQRFGVRIVAYEGGADNGGGSTVNIAARIQANRDPAMGILLKEHMLERWFAEGGDLYSHLGLSGLYSRYGSWGLVEDLANLDTPKYRAIREVIGTVGTSTAASEPAAGAEARPQPPSALQARRETAGIVLEWEAVAGASAYRVYSTTGGNFARVSDDLTITQFVHADAQSTSQTYYVVAVRAGIESVPSASVQVP